MEMEKKSTCNTSDFSPAINKPQVYTKLLANELQALSLTEARFLPKSSSQPKICSKNRFMSYMNKYKFVTFVTHNKPTF